MDPSKEAVFKHVSHHLQANRWGEHSRVGENIAWDDTKKFRDQKKLNFEKNSKTFLGTLVRKLYLNLQLCSSLGIKVLCFTRFFDKSQTVKKD